MLNAVYRLVAPRRFEVEFTNIDLRGKHVIVRPVQISLKPSLLLLRLNRLLIEEACPVVVLPNSQILQIGVCGGH